MLIFIKLFEFRRNLLLKKNIQVQEAKIVMLRMALKSRVRKKVTTLRAQFTKPITAGDHVDEALRQIYDNKFENGDDFQNYFEGCRQVNNYIASEQEITLEEVFQNYGPERYEDFMGPDLNNELSIIRIIKMMTESTSKHFTYVETYNRFNPKVKQKTLDPLLFIALYDVKRVYRDDVEKTGQNSIDIEIETDIANVA